VPVCAHIVLTRQDAAAPAWIMVVLGSPFIGSLLYFMLGINRVVRRARRLRGRRSRALPQLETHQMPFSGLPTAQQRQLFQFGKSVHAAPFVGGNKIKPLVDGQAAYPDMLAAIADAKTSIALSVYIFKRDDIGERFVEALTAAHRRGVLVRVLVDEVGMGRKAHAADTKLAQNGIATARFIPQTFKFLPLINLRNHRKIMIVDDHTGFIGGMNICRNYSGKSTPVRDLHFRVSGAAIVQMVRMFEEDWRFATGETIELPWIKVPEDQLAAPVYARVIADGPDNAFQRTLWIILGALAVSQKSVRILTPYFLPNDILRHALEVCALRGVRVEVVIPSKTDIGIVDYAMAAQFQDLLEHGIKLYYSGKPFDHSKLMLVDGVWALVGSSNWDQRSLRLNFEANLEAYDADLAGELEAHFAGKRDLAKPIALEAVQAQSRAIRLRNNTARLFAPYL
jgi:cardiolipin synthase